MSDQKAVPAETPEKESSSKGRENLVKSTGEAKSIKTLVSKERMDWYNREFDHSDAFLSNSLLTHPNKMSSPRENMFNQQLPQAMMLLNPDVPEIFTGYEHEVGKYSKSYYQSDRQWKVIEKISKFKNAPDLKYFLIVVDANGYFDVINRVSSQQLTESYGFLFQTDVIDSKRKNAMIQSNEILYKSTSFDGSMNYRYGKNVPMVYMSIPEVTEDAQVISDELAKQLQYCMVTTIEMGYNTNETFLNLYGNDQVYKAFPDITEDIVHKVLCAKRRIANKTMLYSLRDHNLRNVHIDEDDAYYADGKVVDIDVFCNKKIDEIPKTPANAQLLYYYDEQQEYYKKIKSVLGKIITKNPGKVSDRLLHLYHRAEDLTSNKSIVNNNTKFENITVVFTIVEVKQAKRGYKLTGRYGEKGVIGHVWPVEKMPINQYGERAHMIASPQGVFGRLNLGQWNEQELTFISHNITRELKAYNIPAPVGIPKILEFVRDVNPKQATALGQYIMSCGPAELEDLYMDMLTNGIKLHQPPFWDNISFEGMSNLYGKYRYPRYKCKINGERVINPLIIGTKYIMLLKQTPQSKYSSRSLGMLSSIGHPSKSIKFKKKNLPKSDTPIRIGEMEVMNLCMMNDSAAVARFLSIYANSPYNRESLVRTILTTNNPLCISNVPVESSSLNRKMLNAFFKCTGRTLIDN